LLRHSALGAATIAFSRSAGSAFLVVLYLRARRELGSVLAVVLGSLLLLAMIGSGSRGPLLSLIPAVGAFGFVVSRPKLLSVIKVGSIAGAALLAWGWIEPYLPIAPLKRLTAFAHGHLGSSELERLNAFRASADVIPSHPFGLGLGGFQGLNVLVGSPRQFPHNIILEAWLEGGWAAGAVLVAVLCIALVRLGVLARLRQLRPESGVLIALFVFLLLNDLVSGELNDSKVLFSVLAMTLSFPGAFARNGLHANSGRLAEGAYAPNSKPS
jgi:hypothetical protein